MLQNLFDEKIISIPDNPTLARVATRVLQIVTKDKSLLDGNDRGLIDKKIVLAYWIADGLNGENFKEFFVSPKQVSSDTVTRAVRFLVSEDIIRLSSAAVKDGQNQAARLSKKSAFTGRR